MPGDPCPQVGTACEDSGGVAVAMCQEDGTWPPVNPGCMCVASATCGNGMVEAGEVCDGSNLNGMTCASMMGANFTGTLVCSADCASVTPMCTQTAAGSMAPPMAGTGG